ncbi:hypothetical protein N7474_009305, partial [Penicillium riverlandense]|uniref:uncharacterized protein n=1 Tax=Penicillium riverlandense TaxID=1903569 RepID=UPI0025470246
GQIQRSLMPSTQSEGSKVADIIACNTIMLALASLGACVRLTAQIHTRRFDVDDVTRYGYGRHFTVIAPDMSTVTTFLKLDFVTSISYLISLTSIKISFCLLYLKVFSVTRLRWLYYFVMAFVICEFIEELFVVIFQCSPIRKLFHPTTVAGACIDLYVFYYVSFGIKLATDAALFLLPIPQLLKLQVRPGAKAGLIVMFGLGLLVCATSIVRITFIRHFQVDYTWVLVQALNWSAVEVCVAIIVASIPSFKVIFSRSFPVLQQAHRLPSSPESRREVDTAHVSPLNADYFSIRVPQRPSGPRDTFPIPSPPVSGYLSETSVMTGGVLSVIPEQVVGALRTPGEAVG